MDANLMTRNIAPMSSGVDPSSTQSLSGASASPEMLYTELSGLQQIKSMGQTDQTAALKKVAKQFESILLKMMLSSMRSVNDTMSAGGLFDSHESKFFRQMYDDQMALSLSERGIGLADTFYKQMVREYLPSDKPLNLDHKLSESRVALNPNYAIQAQKHQQAQQMTESADTVPITGRQNVPSAIVDRTSEQVTEWRQSIPSSGASDRAQKTRHSGEVGTQNLEQKGTLSFESPEAFIKSLLPYARQAGKLLGISPKGILAQAALETGWGQYIMKDAQGNSSLNLFGIKADQRWQGKSVASRTLEFEQGVPQRMTAQFRQYESLSETFKDYVAFLSKSPRYEQAIAAEDVEGFAKGLQQGGYATDPDYARKITRIASSDAFTRWVDVPDHQDL